MTHKERMEAGLIYFPNDPEILAEQKEAQKAMKRFNTLDPLDPQDAEVRKELMPVMFAQCGDHCYLEPPVHANWGGRHVHLGWHVYANFGLTLVDDGHIYIGDRVMFGPNVTIATANHPIDPELRHMGLQYNKEVRIGDNCWIGAGVVIVPGVQIGKNSVIGAGSVVVKDIPEGVVAVGNPCHVIRRVGEHDHSFFYRDEAIDWENQADFLVKE